MKKRKHLAKLKVVSIKKYKSKACTQKKTGPGIG